MKSILSCSNCDLCNNQKPLLDSCMSADVMWIGLSAKKVESLFDEIPLADNTNTGKIIAEIESKFADLQFYKTNIVKCLPLDTKNKLRYPNLQEMDACYMNFEIEHNTVKPALVFLLGKKVSDFVYKKQKKLEGSIDKIDNGWIYAGTTFITIHHPSYIYVYKRKYIADYVEEVQNTIEEYFRDLLKFAS
jgi:uracil-DNA glycosylase